MSLSKEDYLKRYLSPEKKKKKRKKESLKVKNVISRIVDDDVGFEILESQDKAVDEDEDEAPTVAEFVDERPEHIQQLEKFRQDTKWKLFDAESVSIDNDSPTQSKHGRNRYDSESDVSSNHSDQSPPRKHSSHRKNKQSSTRHDSDSDQSPGRSRGHNSDSDQSPPRSRRHDSDQSPPRSPRHDSDSDQSPPRSRRHDSDSDQSPPRSRRHDSESDQSPPRSRRHDSDSDQSPARSRRHDSDSDQSPPRSRRHGSDSDQSPPRSHRQNPDTKHSHQQKKRRYDDSLKQSHKSKGKTTDSDQSPPRKKSNSTKPGQSSNRKRHHGSSSDQSPARTKSNKTDLDQSASRSRERDSSAPSSKKRNRPSRFEPANDKTNISLESRNSITGTDNNRSGDVKAGKTLSGATAGLSSAKLMKDEARKLKEKEMEAFHKIDQELLGRNAATVFRDKSGKRRNLKEEADAEKEKEEKEAVENAKFEKWNKGMKQQELKIQALEDAIHEMSKPLTRHKDDEDLDSMLKEKDREGDPMLAFLKKKKTKDKKEKPRYSGQQPPPNRFGIWPGYRWDGVDRSTGFERQLFAKAAEKKAVRDIAYKWSVEDM